MKSGESKVKIKESLLCLGLCLTISSTMAQPGAELAGLQLKYPKRPVISVAKRLDIMIDLTGNELITRLDDYKELMILADNSAVLADSKEYFSSHFELLNLEAFSLVPEKNQYKKIAVTKFTKTVEIDGNIYYDDQYAMGFTFPSVGKGAKLVTRSTASTKYSYLPVLFDFGGNVPCENMVVTLSCPRQVRINYHLFGNDTSIIRFACFNKGDRTVYQWQASNTKVYDRDDAAPGYRYFIPHLVIQIAGYAVNGEYKPVIGTLNDLYTFNYSLISKLSSTAALEIKVLADSITRHCVESREKVRCLFKWVQKNIKYVAIEDGDNGLIPREAELVLKRRYGDCKDKTSLLVALIRSQNLVASYAWIGSRDLPYKFSEFPSTININHMVAVWWDGEKPVILDGTTYRHSMEDIPAFIQGKECLIERGSEHFTLYTIPVARPSLNMISDSMVIQLRGDTVTGKGYITCQGEQRAKMMAAFEGKDTSSYAGILLRQLPRASNKVIIREVKLSDMENTEQPFRISYCFTLPDYLTLTDQNSYINLYLNRFLQNTKIKDERCIPIESEMTVDHSFYCSMIIPDGYKVQVLPESSAFQTPEFSFSESYCGRNDSIILVSRITLNFQILEGQEIKRFREMLALLHRNYLKSLSLEKIETL